MLERNDRSRGSEKEEGQHISTTSAMEEGTRNQSPDLGQNCSQIFFVINQFCFMSHLLVALTFTFIRQLYEIKNYSPVVGEATHFRTE